MIEKRQSGGEDRVAGPGDAGDAGRVQTRGLRRRDLFRRGFFGSIGIAALLSAGALAKFVWPLNVKGFGGTFVVTSDQFPAAGGEPVKIVEAKAWLSHLEPNEGTGGIVPGNPTGGLLALYWKCPHLGCTVPWLQQFDFQGTTGWFRCPCHQSTYTKAGIRVFGPAPRPMDTFAISLDQQGRLTINTGKVTLGGDDNPQRALTI